MTVVNQVEDALRRFIVAQMETQTLPGMAVALTDRESTLHISTYGYADIAAATPIRPETLFQTGSIGKSFTSIALLQEYEAGRLDLHAPVTTYLPWFAVPSPYPPITIHHLLTHTAGITSGSDFSPDSRTQVWALRDSAAAWAPGERFLYSNDGYKALGLVLDSLTGQPYAITMRERILAPLRMDHTAPTVTNDTRKHLATGYTSVYDDRPAPREKPLAPATWFETETADGCLASTAGDMAIYLRMLLNRGQGAEGRILTPESFDLLTQRAINVDDRRWYGYGLFSWEEDGHTLLGPGGGMPGFVSAITCDLDAGVGAVVLLNGHGDVTTLAGYALHLLRAGRQGLELPLPPALPDPLTVENAAEYAGTYSSEKRSFELRADEQRLLMEYQGTALPLERRGADAFYAPHPDFALALLRFGRGGEHAVTEAFHGADWYVNDRYGGPRAFDLPAEWSAYAGHYRAFTPWTTNFRVLIRKGSLILELPQYGVETPLQPAGRARFTMGDTMPGDLRFGPIVAGQAISASLLSGPYSRVNTP